MKKLVIGGLLLASPVMALAEGTPWLAIPGETSLQLSTVFQSTDAFRQNDDKNQLPADLDLDTIWLSLTHGISDNLAVDFRTGYAESDFAPVGEESGRTDTTLGLTWRFVDEFLSAGNVPSAAVRVAAIFEGNYDPKGVNAIGDGASGLEASIILGKAFTDRFALSGDLGYRYRQGDVPNEVTFNLGAYYSFSQSLSASVGYHNTNSRGDLDIGAPGFSPARFPETEEDIESFDVSLTYNFTPSINMALSYGSVIDGQNTPDNDIYAVSLGVSF